MKQISRLMTCLFMFSTAAVFGGEQGFIGDQLLLPNVRNKIVTVEFDSPMNEELGKDIANVVSRQILGSLSGVPSAGVVTLWQLPGERQEMTSRLLERIAERQRAPMIVWGEFYLADGEVYLHPHLTISRSFHVLIDSLREFLPTASGILSAETPTTEISFSPVMISSTMLQEIHASSAQATKLRNAPDEKAKVVQTIPPHQPFQVLDVKGRWMKISMFGQEGWVQFQPSDTLNEQSRLRSVVLAVCGLLQYGCGNYRAAEQTIMQYLARLPEDEDQMNRAFFHIVLGSSRLRQIDKHKGLPPDNTIATEFQTATQLLPGNSGPINYLAIARYHETKNKSAREIVEKGLLQGVDRLLIEAAQNGEDRVALSNLTILYRDILQRLDRMSPLDPSGRLAELRSRIDENIRIASDILEGRDKEKIYVK